MSTVILGVIAYKLNGTPEELLNAGNAIFFNPHNCAMRFRIRFCTASFPS